MDITRWICPQCRFQQMEPCVQQPWFWFCMAPLCLLAVWQTLTPCINPAGPGPPPASHLQANAQGCLVLTRLRIRGRGIPEGLCSPASDSLALGSLGGCGPNRNLWGRLAALGLAGSPSTEEHWVIVSLFALS